MKSFQCFFPHRLILMHVFKHRDWMYKVTHKKASLNENWKLKCNKDSHKNENFCMLFCYFLFPAVCFIRQFPIHTSNFPYGWKMTRSKNATCILNSRCYTTHALEILYNYWNWYEWKQKRIIFISTFRQILCCFSAKFHTQKEIKE